MMTSKNKALQTCNSRLHPVLNWAITLLLLSSVSCQKESEISNMASKTKKKVIDYVLDAESMYLIKYVFRYNEHLQVTQVYRGERYAAFNQMQLITEAFYREGNLTEYPDSIISYNTKGFKVGLIKPNQYQKVASTDQTALYRWPERENKLLTTPGGPFALAIAGSKINWSGDGHLGSASDIEIMKNIKLANRTSLADSIQVPVQYKSDGSERLVDDYLILYDKMGYPTSISFFDRLNADRMKAEIHYREE